MRRRNAIMAALSIIFLIVLLAAMSLAVASGLGSLNFFIVGTFSYVVLIGLVILAFPVVIFVIITIILLTIEASKATRTVKGWWSGGQKADAAVMSTEEPIEGKR